MYVFPLLRFFLRHLLESPEEGGRKKKKNVRNNEKFANCYMMMRLDRCISKFPPLKYIWFPIDRMAIFGCGLVLFVYLDGFVSLAGDESSS